MSTPDCSLTRLGRSTTIGVMVDWVGDAYQREILAGAMEATSGANANLLCFVGGQVLADSEGSARPRVFELIGSNTVDGLVIFSTTLMHQVGRPAFERYCQERFAKLPRVSLGVELPGVPTFAPDNERGVKETVAHFVREHGARRIAIVRGPVGNDEADRRYRAFAEALEEHGLTLDPRLVAVGNFVRSGGRDAVHKFAQIPGYRLEDLDAIVVSNDTMAIGVASALEERGVEVPNRVALAGFDDIPEARVIPAPLTTVRQALEQLGRNASRALLHSIRTGEASAGERIATELVVRRSCGCSVMARRALRSVPPELNHGFEAAMLLRRQKILDALTRTARGRLGVAGSDWQPKLLHAFVSEMRGESADVFRSMIQDYAQKLLARGGDVRVCHDVCDSMRREICIALRTEPQRRDHAEEIFYAVHLNLSELVQRSMAREELRQSRWGLDVSIACNALTGSFGLQDWRKNVREQLLRLGIETFYVVVYSEDGGAEVARLVVACEEGKELSCSDQEFNGTLLLPEGLRGTLHDGRAFAVMPLWWRTHWLGHLLMELDLGATTAYGPIAEAMSIGLLGGRLAEECASLSG